MNSGKKVKRKAKSRYAKSGKRKRPTSSSRRAADLEQLIIASLQNLPFDRSASSDPDGVVGDIEVLRSASALARPKQKRR
jgi:hypothetical protein